MLSRWIGLLIVLLLIWPSMALAHATGTPKLTNVAVGPYHLYVWISPDPPRVGEVNITAAVVEPEPGSSNDPNALISGGPVLDADVQVELMPVGLEEDPVRMAATHEVAINKLYYEAYPTIPATGEWQVTVTVMGAKGTGSAGFVVDVLPARSANWMPIGLAVIGLLIGIGVFGRMRNRRLGVMVQQALPAQMSGRSVNAGLATAQLAAAGDPLLALDYPAEADPAMEGGLGASQVHMPAGSNVVITATVRNLGRDAATLPAPRITSLVPTKLYENALLIAYALPAAPGVAGYRLLRREEAGGSRELVGETIGLQYYDALLTPGQRYCYAVQAYDAADLLSAPSEGMCSAAVPTTFRLNLPIIVGN